MSVVSNDSKSLERKVSPAKEERRRSASPENEEEELDEFGRVKRRREKFKTERSEDGEYDDDHNQHRHRSDSNDRGRREERYHSSRRRRSSSSPRRYRRHHSDSDSDYERQRSTSRHRHRRSRHHHSRQQHRGNGADLYTEAAQYIDTEFYPTKVYIGDLEGVTVEQIETIFARFGPLEDVKLVEGKDYGFITFEKKEAALAAIQSMHGALLGSRHIKVNRAKIPERNKVGFGNVPWQDEDGLMAKESYSYSRRRSSTLMKLDDHAYPPITTAIPAGRVLTSYDDL
ncbi:uncharacterized protein EV154DRAFT_564497 [Mucor mucedo]|uniref:uncharacterized protein n=1 Tax=Mucor mucedo TaxID=29922 RepID=UPI00221F84F7|nr:uncharacterized protein EV154DRAFT_564497 [Mucor mucedo]KAI7890343.1 hypothetical protein EV154DRAFT_564497 [Mucor mucedo]